MESKTASGGFSNLPPRRAEEQSAQISDAARGGYSNLPPKTFRDHIMSMPPGERPFLIAGGDEPAFEPLFTDEMGETITRRAANAERRLFGNA